MKRVRTLSSSKDEAIYVIITLLIPLYCHDHTNSLSEYPSIRISEYLVPFPTPCTNLIILLSPNLSLHHLSTFRSAQHLPLAHLSAPQ